jgi:two-component system LytT family response regulator
MNPITTYVIDDEPHAIEILSKYIGMTPGLQLLGTALDAQSALVEIRTAEPPDLTFLDIDMPVLSGIEAARLIRNHTNVIFTTSFREYGAEAFDNGVLDYLLKPFSYERFVEAVQKFRKNVLSGAGESEAAYFFVKAETKGKLIRVALENLADEQLLTHSTLQEMANNLPAANFVRIHKSFVINLKHVKAIEARQVRMDNRMVVPIGRAYYEDFQRRLTTLTLTSQREKF